MDFFHWFRRPDMDAEVKEFRKLNGAWLLDVRTPEEFLSGRVPGAVNLPLQEIEFTPQRIPDLDAPIFVYCRSGARSRKAVRILRSTGYRKVKDLGGIQSYRGPLER